MQVLSENAWMKLVRCVRSPEVRGWASEGVFATAVGPDFVPGAADTLFYVGKAGGPLIDSVGITEDQSLSAAAGVKWMLDRRNPSAFWVFADLLTSRRELMAWSNIAKIDTRSPRPPNSAEWNQIRDVCLGALKEEMEALRPARTVFATSNFCVRDTLDLLHELNFFEFLPDTPLEETRCFQNKNDQLAVITRHPQGWGSEARNRVASFVRSR